MDDTDPFAEFWSRPAADLMQALKVDARGLDAAEAAHRLQIHGKNVLTQATQQSVLRLFFARFRSPLVLILIFAALMAIVMRDWLDAIIVIAIIMLSATLSTVQEYRASDAVSKLSRRVSARSTVLRNGTAQTILSEEVVPGDLVLLSAGSLIPADGIVLDTKDFFVGQALLTGETFPVEKQSGTVPAQAGIAERNNCAFMGTSVRSGTATLLIVKTANSTLYGNIAKTMTLGPPETEFERGLRHFGGLLMRVMMIVVLAVLTINILLQRPTVDTLLFAMALAVGLSPELLPAILAVTLAHGAQKMAKHGVIVRHASAIENLGSMNVLCTDKTGTLTKGVVDFDQALAVDGNPSDHVLQLACLNSILQTGLRNPLDEAIIRRANSANINDAGFKKLDEIPYDFVRKRLSVVVQREQKTTAVIITKGALQNVLDICVSQQNSDSVTALNDETRANIQKQFANWSEQGFRVLGIAYKDAPIQTRYERHEETAMVFLGFLLFLDPPEPGVRHTLDALHRLGVQVKMITGDNHLVARHVAEAVGMKVHRILTGFELTSMRDEALWHLAPTVDVFAEVDPNQKERIILALQKTGNVVGYLGDGINDAPALHAADVGISVDNAVDVAKEAADFVLLKHDLDVLRKGINEGRHTFANTIKYIFITTSANFGNMISMAFASFFLPFLPLLATQILLNNMLSDIPAMGIAGDNVDREWERTPHRWDIHLIRNFMFTFGLVSSVFDLITFGALYYLVGETPEAFRTGWFIESLLTELLIIFVIRTYRPFYQSRPGKFILWSSAFVAVFTVALPFTPVGIWFGFTPLSPLVLGTILGISLAYAAASEFAKRVFYRKFNSVRVA